MGGFASVAPDRGVQLDSRRVGLFDEDIRAALIDSLRKEDPTAVIVEELPLLRGRGRADLAFINGSLCGYEIKSEHDSLVRLGTQTDQYQSAFEFVTLVVTRKHLKSARNRVPSSWGLILAERATDGCVRLTQKRTAKKNNATDPKVLVRLLWKQECLRILKRVGVPVSAQTAVIMLWEQLETLPRRTLCDQVRLALKARQKPSAQLQIQYDDLRPIEPKP